MRPLRARPVPLISVVAVFLFTLQLCAQEPSQSTTDGGSSADACLQRSIPLTVMPVGDQPSLGSIPLLGRINNSPVMPVATRYDGPLRVVLLIDISASMKAARSDANWGMGYPTAALALDAIPMSATVAVGTFAEKLNLSSWQSRSSARDKVLPLNQQVPKGHTALYSAVSEAASAFDKAQFGDAIYLVTDGGENHSATDLNRTVANLVSKGIRVSVFLVVPPEYKTPEERNGFQEMVDLTQATGGLLEVPPWSKEWVSNGGAAKAAEHIRAAISAPYRVDLQLTSPLTKPAKLKLETSLDPKRYTVAYPRRLEPYSNPPTP